MSNPFQRRQCERQDCLVCQRGGKGKRSATGVTYELVCQECNHKYVGETSRSACSRGKEHLYSLNHREENPVMWKHACEGHGGNIPDFVMNVTGVFREDAMLRPITEAALISKTQKGQLKQRNNGIV